MSFLSRYILLDYAEKFEDFAILLLRLATGVFLVHGVWDNIRSPERMTEFIVFMDASGFTHPQFWAPFSVYTQFLAGLMTIAGLLTRWAGLIIVGTFLVALYMVHWEQSLREWWPALSLVVIGMMFATRGAGHFSIDVLLRNRLGR